MNAVAMPNAVRARQLYHDMLRSASVQALTIDILLAALCHAYGTQACGDLLQLAGTSMIADTSAVARLVRLLRLCKQSDDH